jgi:hypothetical protein
MSKTYKTDKRATSEWAAAKHIRETRGISAPQLRRYAGEGLIRTSNIRRTEQLRGIRLYNVRDIDRLIELSIEPHAGAEGAAQNNQVSK